MSRCRACRKRIPEALFGELDMKERETLDRHLAACPRCASLFRGMAAALKKMDVRPAPDPGPDFWEGYWDRLERRMSREERAGRTEASGRIAPARPFRMPRWAFGAAGAAALLLAGIFLGRTLFRPLGPTAGTGLVAERPFTTAGGPAAASPADLATRASRYLDRSRVLLLAVVNFDPASGGVEGLNLPLQKLTSDQLIKEAAGLKKELRGADRRLERLVADLQTILMQIANLKAQADPAAVEIIKSGIESRDILFKIDLSEIRRSAGKAGADRARRDAKTAA